MKLLIKGTLIIIIGNNLIILIIECLSFHTCVQRYIKLIYFENLHLLGQEQTGGRGWGEEEGLFLTLTLLGEKVLRAD